MTKKRRKKREKKKEHDDEEEGIDIEESSSGYLTRADYISTLWQHTVSDYSCLQLTMDKDIFPAISGIAQQQQRARGSNYLAGLWEDTLTTDLMWHTPAGIDFPWTPHRDMYVPRPTKWRAPTRSWASIKSPVEFQKYNKCFSSVEAASTGHVADGSTVHCLELGTTTTQGSERDSVEMSICFLILRKLERPKGVEWAYARYERIGFGSGKKANESLENFVRSLKSETIIIL
jgi:hypothetical protein